MRRMMNRHATTATTAAATAPAARSRSRAGFTLVELLAALIVVGLLTATVCVGVTTAMRTYERDQFASQSQMLSGMIENVLSDPLRFMTFEVAEPADPTDPADPADPAAAPSVTYKLSYRNIPLTNPQLDISDGYLILKGTNESQPETIPLLNDGAYGNCTVSSVTFAPTPDTEKGTVTSTVTVVIARGDMTRTYTYTFKSLGNNASRISSDSNWADSNS